MICDKNKCTGCFSCFNSCPKNAITMKKDEYGNIYPVINQNKCINCGLCKRKCPSLNIDKIIFKKPQDAYALYNKDAKLRSESSSGGAASLFSEFIIKNGGIVYGASNLFNDDKFQFIRLDNVEDLYKIKGSKYVHCYLNETFRSIKNDLDNSLKVLFVGTPCQVAGLLVYLGKNYENLFTVDIICHGVPSQTLFFDEMNSLGLKLENIYKVSFRDSKGFNFKVFDNNNNIIYEGSSHDVRYYKNFLDGTIYRDNCYSCVYAQNKRISNITIGDFWGLGKDSSINDNEFDGISLVLINDDKGFELFNNIKDNSIYEKRSVEEAIKGNGQLNSPVRINVKHKIYKKYYVTKGYDYTMSKMIVLKDKIKKMINNIRGM